MHLNVTTTPGVTRCTLGSSIRTFIVEPVLIFVKEQPHRNGSFLHAILSK